MLCFVTALEPEARPLVARWRLARDLDADAFKVYRRDDVALVVSGPGKVAAAAATAYLHLHAGRRRAAAWLNVGVAGHPSLAPGEAVLAHKIRDRASGESWYPPHVFQPRIATGEVVTVDEVERRFAEEAAYEMEASGFYPTACRFATAELVQCVKVVSDGPATAPESLTAKRLEDLVGDAGERIAELADDLTRLAREARGLVEDPPELGEMVGRWHFTVTEERQLRRLLQRWHTLAPERPLPREELAALERGREVVRLLRGRLDEMPDGG